MKQYIKGFIPASILGLRLKWIITIKAKRYTNEKFKSWWNKYKTSSNLDPDLIYMVDSFIKTDAFDGMSKYWNYLNQKNLEQINDSGIDNFKQTVSTNYYTWINGIKGALGKNILKNIEQYNLAVPINQIVKSHSFLTIDESIIFNTMTVLMYDYVNSTYPDVINDCVEGSTGNSLYISINNKNVSQDILSSAIEYSSIVKGLNDLPKSVLELGAGSGRTAEFFLKKHKNIKYIICDIAPALYVSQYYLSSIFSDKHVFKFKEFDDYSSVKEEFESSDIAFVMPSQLKLLPDNYVDVFLAIDCLHEMKEEQVGKYFQVANRLADNFYFKVWKDTTIPFDNINLTEEKYVPLNEWTETFKRDCYIPGDFFEAMYKCNK